MSLQNIPVKHTYSWHFWGDFSDVQKGWPPSLIIWTWVGTQFYYIENSYSFQISCLYLVGFWGRVWSFKFLEEVAERLKICIIWVWGFFLDVYFYRSPIFFFFSRGLSLIFGTGIEICFSPFSHSMNVSWKVSKMKGWDGHSVVNICLFLPPLLILFCLCFCLLSNCTHSRQGHHSSPSRSFIHGNRQTGIYS